MSESVVYELRFTAHGRDDAEGERAYRGLGVRDLARDGDDLLELAGPALLSDGAAAVLRWRAPLDTDGRAGDRGDVLVHADRLERLVGLPYGGDDWNRHHPEGLARVDGPDGEGMLVVYDSPTDDRTRGEGVVEADWFPLGTSGG